MERIKQAIENAKNPGAMQSTGSSVSSARREYQKSDKPQFKINRETIKIISGVVLIIFAGWLWMRLDFMNQLELIASEYINDGVKQARAEAKRRGEEEAKFRQMVSENLAYCLEAAERDNENYMKLAQKEVRRKNNKSLQGEQVKFYIPGAALKEAARMLEQAKAECQQISDSQLKNGR